MKKIILGLFVLATLCSIQKSQASGGDPMSTTQLLGTTGAAALITTASVALANLNDSSPLLEQAYAGHGELLETLSVEMNISVEQAAQLVLDTKAKADAQ